VEVELKNESAYRGRLEEVDRAGNLRFSQARLIKSATSPPPSALSPTLDSLFLPGRSLRYLELPDRVDGVATLIRHERKLDDQLTQWKRKKRSGKFITREEQEKQVEKKQRKLQQEMESRGGGHAAAAPQGNL
jgi:small nuclear ribonucleoprotein (snRNP)-like protein